MPTQTVDDALAEVKVRANIPTSNGALTDAELLQLGNAELRGIMTGRLMEAMQGYLLTETTSSTSTGTALYDVPTRAVGNKLAYVSMQQSTGDRRPLMSKSGAGLGAESRAVGAYGPPSSFYWQGTQIGLYPAPNDASESLVLGYYMRPNRMVLQAACAILTAAPASGATSLAVTNTGTVIASGTTVDIVSAQPHFRSTSIDRAVSAANTTTLTVTALSAAAAIGDWVCPAGDSCVIQLPLEVQPLLVARWALKAMKVRAPSSPDTQALGQDVSDLEDSLFNYLSQRVESAPETLGPPGLLYPGARPLGWGSAY